MQSSVSAIIDDLSNVIFGKKQQIKLALTCLFSEGHLLIEDLPGMGSESPVRKACIDTEINASL